MVSVISALSSAFHSGVTLENAVDVAAIVEEVYSQVKNQYEAFIGDESGDRLQALTRAVHFDSSVFVITSFCNKQMTNIE